MTFRRWFALAGLLLTTIISGCNSGQTEPGPTVQSDSDTTVTAPTTDAQPQDPAKAVRVFLQSLRNGDQEIAAQLLTEKARTETAKLQLVVEPPGTPSAEYAVGEVEYQEDPNEAHVLSNWTETTDEGTETYQVVWITKKDGQAWRIAGMATRQVGSLEALLVDFEDAEMLGQLLDREEPSSQPSPENASGSTTQPAQPASVTNGPSGNPAVNTATQPLSQPQTGLR